MGIDPALLHLNEGHAAFAALELARQSGAPGAALDEALERARAQRILFTTHTPGARRQRHLPARDAHARRRALRGARPASTSTGSPASGTRPTPQDRRRSALTEFAIHSSAQRNGVSRRHGEVAREMWHALWPDLSAAEVPIGHVTNGVHQPTWVGASMRSLLDRHLGADWLARSADAGDLGGGRADPRPRAVGGAPRTARRA